MEHFANKYIGYLKDTNKWLCVVCVCLYVCIYIIYRHYGDDRMIGSIQTQSVRCGSQATVIYSKISVPNDCGKWSLKICMSTFSLIVINQAGISCTRWLAGWLLTPRHWLQGVYAVVLNHRRRTFGASLLADERQSWRTHALVCLFKKQTTTIILISALFRPLQQSSRLSSEGTWVSLIHHREYLNHIAPIVRRSPGFDSPGDDNANILLSKSRLTPRVIGLPSWNHLHREKQIKIKILQRCVI